MAEETGIESYEEFEFEIIPETVLILPISRGATESSPFSKPPPKVSLSLEQRVLKYTEEFKELAIIVKVESDDARLRALDIYTQYSGIHTLLITHAPKSIWPAGILFYSMTPDWDDTPDRVLGVDQTAITQIEYPVDYAIATGLFARSWTLEASEGSPLYVGIVKSGESGQNYGNPSEIFTIRVFFGMTTDATEEGGEEVSSQLVPHNPLCEIEFTFTDAHPIPFAIYNVWGYFCDSFGSGAEYPLGTAVWLGGVIYEPGHLRVGRILSCAQTTGAYYIYTVKCLTALEPEVSFETIETEPEILKYEIDRYVLLAKDEEEGWTIVPSSEHYWEDAVDFIRRYFGEE